MFAKFNIKDDRMIPCNSLFMATIKHQCVSSPKFFWASHIGISSTTIIIAILGVCSNPDVMATNSLDVTIPIFFILCIGNTRCAPQINSLEMVQSKH